MKPIKIVFTLLVFIVSFAGFGNLTADPDKNSTTDQFDISQVEMQSVDVIIIDDLIITDATASKTSDHYNRLDKIVKADLSIPLLSNAYQDFNQWVNKPNIQDTLNTINRYLLIGLIGLIVIKMKKLASKVIKIETDFDIKFNKDDK